ncbi:ATP-binding protein [Roseovarius indicus]|uniref:C4-dicarboxylate transport sensor protein DctB n=2 Tax=Roseovarius indicus TaxID=540747 RepID=A0A0T5P3U2_9RHOB|nr:ATP-binding protein [Roseovarius indicus]KRS15906.1 C4-dicarboxylate ABC transporter [Roseovarius indicus]
MTKMLRTRLLVVVLFLGAVGACAAGIWRYAHVEALAQIEKQGRADLALASDRFTGELRRFRELAVLMAEHPVFDDLTAEDGVARADWVLQDAADKSGALALFYTDTAGTVLARAGNVTLRPAGSRYFRRAMRGALGTFYGRLGPDGVRVYAFAAPAFGPDGVKGSVIALVDMAEVEWDWIGGQPPVFFTDADGRIFLSNRSEILGWQPRENGEAPAPPIEPAPDFSAVWRSGYEIWRLDWGDYLPRAALHLAKAEPVIGMTGHALVDTAPARRIAWLQTSVFTVICLSFGVVLLLLGERRRTLARANAQLETRVSERTAELSEANIALRREVQERQEAEAALKRAQDELVQAGKLSALGQMSAGISHELNQPLMAIQQFADNGGSFLAKGRTDAAGENLNRISQLAARAARIIKNLRAFARNESEPMGKVDLVQVMETAVELTDARLRKDEVTLDWQAPAQPVYALGGEVRLVQVFVNLINNAADAMSGQVERRISIAIDAGPPLAVTVRDIGPGISAPDKMFEPFYTTKAVGSDDGMGLGLSISYGLVQSFGGNIRGTNAPDGGAVMTVELERWQEEAAA